MLNYLFVDHHDHFKINSILQINKDMMQDFFSNYALDILSDNDCRAPEVIWRCVRVCTFTMRRIVLKHGDRMSLKVDDLIAPRKIIDFRGKGMTIYAPNFVAHGGSIPDPLAKPAMGRRA